MLNWCWEIHGTFETETLGFYHPNMRRWEFSNQIWCYLPIYQESSSMHLESNVAGKSPSNSSMIFPAINLHLVRDFSAMLDYQMVFCQQNPRDMPWSSVSSCWHNQPVEDWFPCLFVDNRLFVYTYIIIINYIYIYVCIHICINRYMYISDLRLYFLLVLFWSWWNLMVSLHLLRYSLGIQGAPAHQRSVSFDSNIPQLSVLVAYQPVAICQTQTTQFCWLHVYIYILIYWLIDWLIDWLVGWLIAWLIVWLIDWLIKWLSYHKRRIYIYNIHIFITL